jgi:dTDP-4-dehydrorhamnose reductase
MKRLLVTGASGFLGWNICRIAKSDWTIYGIYNSHPIDIKGVKLIKNDIGKYNDLKNLFKQVKPDAVIHMAVVPDPNFCQENQSLSYKINTEAAINIAGLCSDLVIPCLFTSTDLVFDGLNPPYREEDEPSPLNIYGEHKTLAEIGMKRRCQSLVICRMPLMFGDPGPVASGFIKPLIRNMKLGIEVNLFKNEFRTPLSGKKCFS